MVRRAERGLTDQGVEAKEGSSPPAEVAFLLGAGASVEAGLPVLDRLTAEVADRLEGEHLRTLYERLWKGHLLAHEAERRNVEDVLSAADALYSARLLLPAAARAEGEAHTVESSPGPAGGLIGPRDFGLLAFNVRKAVWRRLSQLGEIGYLDPLRELVDRYGSLPIASLNNDLVIETWADRQGLTVERGFDSHGGFDAERLDDSEAGIRLVKLHGSVDWTFEAATGLRQLRGRFRTAHGTAPMRSPLPEAAVVFPSRVKVLQILPLRELFGVFDRVLAGARVLVIVGCNLGDEHVVEAVVEAARRNRTLRILVVDPGPPAALERLARAGRGFALEDRLDVLPRGLGDALEGRHLLRRLERLRAGRLSPGRMVALALDRLSGGSGVEDPVGSVEDALGGSVPADEWEELEDILAERALPRECKGPIADAHHAVLDAVSEPVSVRGERIVEALRRWPKNWKLQGQASYPTEHEGQIFFLAKRYRWRIGKLDRRWSVEWVGPELGPVQGLVVEGRHVHHFRKSLFGREGLAILRRLDLESGRIRWRLLRRRGAGSRTTRELLRAVGQFRKGEEPTAAKELLRSCGFLSWPTALYRIGKGRLLVVESVEASVVDTKTGKVVGSTGPDFLNLADAAVASPHRVYLLEGGFRGEGRLLLWRPVEDVVEDVLLPLRNPSGIAYDPEGERLLVTSEEAGLVLEVPLESDGTLKGEVREVARGLPGVRWVCRRGAGEWLVSTARGLLGLELEPNSD